MEIQNEIIRKIQKIRENNNTLWMQVLDLAFKFAPGETKEIFKQITDNDSEITKLSKELCQ